METKSGSQFVVSVVCGSCADGVDVAFEQSKSTLMLVLDTISPNNTTVCAVTTVSNKSDIKRWSQKISSVEHPNATALNAVAIQNTRQEPKHLRDAHAVNAVAQESLKRWSVEKCEHLYFIVVNIAGYIPHKCFDVLANKIRKSGDLVAVAFSSSKSLFELAAFEIRQMATLGRNQIYDTSLYSKDAMSEDMHLWAQSLGLSVEYIEDPLITSPYDTEDPNGETCKGEFLLKNKWKKYYSVGCFDKMVLYKGINTASESILAGAAIPIISDKSHPIPQVFVESKYPEVFNYNPAVKESLDIDFQQATHFEFDDVVDISKMGVGSLAAMLQKWASINDTAIQGIFVSEGDVGWARYKMEQNGLPDTPWVCMCNESIEEKVGNQIDADVFEDMHYYIREVLGFNTITVGFNPYYYQYPYNVTLNLAGVSTIRQMIAAMSMCDVYVGNCTWVYYAAQIIGKPSVVFMGSDKPEQHVIYPDITSVVRNESLGCLECGYWSGGVGYYKCARGEQLCSKVGGFEGVINKALGVD